MILQSRNLLTELKVLSQLGAQNESAFASAENEEVVHTQTFLNREYKRKSSRTKGKVSIK